MNSTVFKKTINSPMNYMGGKKKLINRLLEIFPEKINTFVDLFCGGCTVGLNVTADNIVFNDAITPMIQMYEEFTKHSLNDIIDYIENRIKEYNLSMTNAEGYLSFRKMYNKERNPLDLFVLVCYSFNNQIRFNSKGEFNMPFGKNRSHFNPSMKKNLIDFIVFLKGNNCRFINEDFRDINFENLKEGDMVYADPPYLISSATYNTTWTEKEEYHLLALLDKLNEKGIYFALSNVLENKGKTNDILKKWSEKYNVIHLDISYANSSYHRKDKESISDEVVITNFKC